MTTAPDTPEEQRHERERAHELLDHLERELEQLEREEEKLRRAMRDRLRQRLKGEPGN